MKTNVNFSLSLNESVMNIKLSNSIELTIKLNEVINDIKTFQDTLNSVIYLIPSEHKKYLELDKEQMILAKTIIEETCKSNFTIDYKVDSDGHLKCNFNGEYNLNLIKYIDAINNLLNI